MTKIFRSIKTVLTGYWVTGAIFDKELRVASRHKLYYAIRFIYVVALLVILVMAWRSLSYSYSTINISVYMTRTIEQICQFTVILQFFAAQIVAVLLLSGAIAEEIRRRTLPVLLTTPITSFQIVGGKILSKLIQVWMLLCLSLPVFAIFRVYGGIPWNFIITTTAVTLAAVFFVASLTVLVGTFFKHTYSTLLVSAIIIFLYYYLAVQWRFQNQLAALMTYLPGDESIILSFNPYYVFAGILEDEMKWRYSQGRIYLGFGIIYGSLGITNYTLSWCAFIQSGMITCLSLVFLWVASRRIRKIAGKQLAGESNEQKRRLLALFELLINKLPRISLHKRVRTVKGHAMIWKEMHNSLIRGELLRGRYLYLLLIGAIVITYSLFLLTAVSDVESVLTIVIVCLAIGAVLVTIIAAASSVTKEKETASWHILLATPMSSKDILWGKMVGVLRRSAAVWTILLLLLAILSYGGMFSYSCLAFAAIIASGITILLTGTGIYLSVRLKSTPRAIMTLLLIAFGLWGVPPILCEIIPGFYRYDLYDYILPAHPLAQLFRSFDSSYFYSYHYYHHGFEDFLESRLFIVINALIYALIGAAFAWQAKVIVRRNIH